jgi:hypothetical protein
MQRLNDKRRIHLSSACRSAVRIAAALSAVLAIGACSDPNQDDWNRDPTALPPGAASPAGGATSQAAFPPAVPETEVLAAVREAQTAIALPDSISPGDLKNYVLGEPEYLQENGCEQGYSTTLLRNLTPCTVGSPASARTMVVIGDSNAQMWSRGLDLVGKRNDWRIIFLTKNNCGPATLEYYLYPLQRDFPECDSWQKWRMDQVNQLKPAVVLLSGWGGGNTGPNRPMTSDDWTNSLVATIQQIPAGTKTVLLSNQPHIKKTAGECLAQNISDISKCAAPASDVIATDVNDIIEKSASATNSTYINVTPWFCDQKCPQVIAGMVPYSSLYHITGDYGMYLSGVLANALGPVMK